ncbi:hypothetical protein [Sphingobium lignivorans]|uniref:Phage tail tape measure protein n=1 Tax=Sphingobium lignivorans TaxID=2735886 RepID=A0ABR6NJH6_9SPHN|nr:hypothetical protein [Sphingobium lignivorans]MBB5987436.1 hypothetical protein [Sphingobium lignivorans]
MAEKLGEAVLELRTDDSQLNKGIEKAKRNTDDLVRRFERIGSRAKLIGAKLSLAFTVPATIFGKAAFDAASDAAEMESAFEVSFGNAADSVRKWAEETGNAMGRSTQELMRQSASFMDILKKQMDPAAAAELSKQLTVLTQDLASFKNLSNETAQQKIFSGLIGEAEPLRAVGVLLSENAVKAKAMEMGLGGVNGALTEGQKVMARAALIQEQLADAQGDVLRTSGSTENQIKRANAAWEELQIVVGTKLLPVITPLIAGVADLVSWFTELPAPVQNFVLIAGGIMAVLGPVIAGIGALATGIAAVIPLIGTIGAALSAAFVIATGPVGLTIAAITALIAIWWKWGDDIKRIVAETIGAVKTWLVDKFGQIVGWVKEKIEAVKKYFADMYDAVVGHSWVPDMIDEVGQHFDRLDDVMVKPADEATRDVKASFAGMADSISGTLDGIASNIKSGDWMGALRGVVDIVGQVSGAIGGKGGGVVSSIAGTVGKFLSKGFAGLFADGGLIPKGQWGIAGERGPEPVIGTARGTVVLPNSSLAGAISGGPNVTIPISIDATGADAAALGRVESQLAELRRDLPNVIVRTVSDARSRRMI